MHRGALLGPGDCTWPWPPAVHYRRPQWEQPAEARTTTQGGMLSCASRASSIWLTALPIHNALTLSNSAFCNAFQFRLGLSPRPMHAPRVRCGLKKMGGCGALVDPPPGSPEPDFFQHAEKCPQLAAARSARHNILCGTWCQVMQSAGVPISLEPNCSRVSAGSNPVTSALSLIHI